MSNSPTGPDSAQASLQAARDAYNGYMKDQVRPILGIAQKEEDSLTDAQIALRIADLGVRREYVRRAIAMLEANVRYYPHAAAPIVAPERYSAIPVVVGLLAAAAGYYFNGPVAALLLAAAGYWVGHHHSRSQTDQRIREADSHNAEVADWKHTIDGWEISINELRAIETET